MTDPQQDDLVVQENVDYAATEGSPTPAQMGISESALAGPAKQDRLARKVPRLSEVELAEVRQRVIQNQYAARERQITERFIRQAQDEIRLAQIRREIEANTPLYTKGKDNLVKGASKHAGTWTQERIGNLQPTRLVKNALKAGLPFGKPLPYVLGEVGGVALHLYTELPSWAIAAIGPTVLADQIRRGIVNIKDIRSMVGEANSPKELEQLLLKRVREREETYPKGSHIAKDILAGAVVGTILGSGVGGIVDAAKFGMEYGEEIARLAMEYGDDAARLAMKYGPELVKEYADDAALAAGRGLFSSADNVAVRATTALTHKDGKKE